MKTSGYLCEQNETRWSNMGGNAVSTLCSLQIESKGGFFVYGKACFYVYHVLEFALLHISRHPLVPVSYIQFYTCLFTLHLDF